MDKSKINVENFYPIFLGTAYFLVCLSLAFSFQGGPYQGYPEAILLFALLPVITIFPVLIVKENEISKKLKYAGLALNGLNAVGILLYFSVVGG